MFQPTQTTEKKMISKVLITVLVFMLKLPICFKVTLLLLSIAADATQLCRHYATLLMLGNVADSR